MFKNMKLAAKIASGFGGLILIAIALGGLAVVNMLGVKTHSTMLSKEFVPEVSVATDIHAAANRAMYQMRGYNMTENPQYFELAQEEFTAVDKALAKAVDLEKGSKNLVKLAAQVQASEKARSDYGKLSEEAKKVVESMAKTREQLLAAADSYRQNCNDFLTRQNEAMLADTRTNAGSAKIAERLKKITVVNDIIDLGNETRLAAWKSQALRDPQIINDAVPNFDRMDAMFNDLRAITRNDVAIKQIADTRTAALEYKSAMTLLLQQWETLQNLGTKSDETAASLIGATRITADDGLSRTQEIADNAASSLTTSSVIMIIGLIVALAVGILLAFGITLGITKPINEIINGLTSGSGAVSSASGQLSGASQDLSAGASEQASSLEEVSSSLEEMASMTKQNADNARQADQLMADSKNLVLQGQGAMGKLGEAMDEIKNSSNKTAKIIKNIDEIAFQTNLLALNAAVEAARAGEAGKGFAVVAEEVRNLAMRAAEAAKDTAALIEQAQKNSDNGVSLAADTSKSITEIAESSIKVGGLVAEIAAASKEQSAGIGQVNTAVAQMDQVTQQNAATAEESSSAAEELSAQALSLNDIVQQLVGLVGGAAGASEAAAAHPVVRHLTHAAHHALPSPATRKPKKVGPGATSTVVRPEQVLPFDDDDDLKDF